MALLKCSIWWSIRKRRESTCRAHETGRSEEPRQHVTLLHNKALGQCGQTRLPAHAPRACPPGIPANEETELTAGPRTRPAIALGAWLRDRVAQDWSLQAECAVACVFAPDNFENAKRARGGWSLFHVRRRHPVNARPLVSIWLMWLTIHCPETAVGEI